MNLIIIIILVVILFLTIFMIILLLVLLKKHRNLVLETFAKDLNNNLKFFHLKKIEWKTIPITLANTKENIYFTSKAVMGYYENPEKIINDKNHNVTHLLKNSKLKIFYHYNLINLGNSKFIALNKIDLLLSKDNLYIFHPLTPETLKINKIKKITFFWEKNSFKKREFMPGIAFNYQNNHYFLLFQTYNEAIKLLVCLNNIITLKHHHDEKIKHL